MLINRYGAIRLLSAIAKQCTFFKLDENWCEQEGEKSLAPLLGMSRPNYNENRTNYTRDIGRTMIANRFPRHNAAIDVQRNSRNNPWAPRVSPPTFNQNSRPHHPHWNRRFPQAPRDVGRRSCFNCGETNHLRSECRFDYQLQCNICKEFGHKTRLCYTNA